MRFRRYGPCETSHPDSVFNPLEPPLGHESHDLRRRSSPVHSLDLPPTDFIQLAHSRRIWRFLLAQAYQYHQRWSCPRHLIVNLISTSAPHHEIFNQLQPHCTTPQLNNFKPRVFREKYPYWRPLNFYPFLFIFIYTYWTRKIHLLRWMIIIWVSIWPPMKYVGWSDTLLDHIDYKYYYLEILADCFRNIGFFKIQ